VCEEATGGNLLILVRVVLVLDVEPLLQAQVKNAAQFAREQGGITASKGTERRQNACNGVESGLVNGDDRGCKGSKGFVSVGSETLTKKGRHMRQEVSERLSSSSIKAFIDGLVGDSNTRIVPHTAGGKQAPDGEAAGGTVENTEEKSGPKEEGREDTRSSGSRGRGVLRNKVGKKGL
jgi:hypothetical protein